MIICERKILRTVRIINKYKAGGQNQIKTLIQ
jgi:hypothetical protein